jgi:hypothetical protein
MKTNRVNYIWGLALIAAGVVFLAQNLGYLSNFTPIVWAIFFTGLSLVFLVSYFTSGLRAWPWLFPAMTTGGIAVTIGLDAAGVQGSLVGAPVLGFLVVPFLAAYAVNTKQNWWALIPAWVLGVLTLVIIISDRVPGEFIGSFFLFAIGLPFLVVFLTNRKENWWALIPGGIMLVLSAIPLLTLGNIPQDLMGAVIMFLFALPFLVVYLWTRANWWALIPCGVFLSIGVMVLLVRAGFQNNPGVITGVLFLGLAVTFFALWLQRGVTPTDWAKYPAGILLILGAITAGLGMNALQIVWPIAIIALGSVLLYAALRRRSV